MNMKKEIEKILNILGLEEKPEKYIDSIEYILDLFNEIDRYIGYAEDLEPLYNPMNIELEPDNDIIKEWRNPEYPERDDDGYVRGPPLKRR